MTLHRLRITVAMAVVAALALLLGSPHAWALTIDISGPGMAKASILLSRPMPGEGGSGRMPTAMVADLQGKIDSNLKFMPFLRSMPPAEVLGGDAVETPKAPGIDFKRLTLSKVDFLVTSAWKEPQLPGKPQVTLRAYETFQGNFLFGQEYSDVKPEELQDIADRFCAKLMEMLTGRKGFFGSKLAFARRDEISKEIFVAGPTGTGARRITSLGGINTSPSWSPDGSRIAFTHIGERGHKLGIADAATGRVDLREVTGGAAISPVFLPNGSLAMTMDVRDDQNIYLVDSAGVNLPYQGGVFPGQYGAARIFYYNSLMRRYLHIPQIAAGMGPCIAGGSWPKASSSARGFMRGAGAGGGRRCAGWARSAWPAGTAWAW